MTDVSQTATLALGFKENGSENLGPSFVIEWREGCCEAGRGSVLTLSPFLLKFKTDYILATDVPLYTSNGTFEVTLPSNLTLKTD